MLPTIHWTSCIPGARHDQLLRHFRRMLREATSDTTWVLHLWQNSLRHLTIDQARNAIDHHIQLVNDINMERGMRHRIVWPETDVVPELTPWHDKILRLNLVLRLANERCGFRPCMPTRITSPVRYTANGRPRQGVTPSRWREGRVHGYHVASRYVWKYFRFFRRYLRHNDSDL